MKVDSKSSVILSIVQLILAKVLFTRIEPESLWFDGMFQLVQKTFVTSFSGSEVLTVLGF